MYDLIIVGGGPAGAAAGVYAARKQLTTLFLTDEWGGQSTVSPDVQNWIGTKSISGDALAKELREHVEQYAKTEFLEIKSPIRASALTVDDEAVRVETENGETYAARTLLVTTGAHRRKLDVPGAKEFDQKGLTYCASCDGPLFSGQDVAVIGGGNAGFETAAQLLAYTKSVTLLDRGPQFRADEITVNRVLTNEHMTAHHNAVPTEILGDKFVTGLKWKDGETGDEHTLDVAGVFVEIGLVPNTDWLGEAVELNEHKQIVISDFRRQTTSHKRVWAAGDCTNGLYHQNNIAAGDAVKALEDIYVWLRAR